MEIRMTVIPGGKPGKVGKLSVKAGDQVAKGDVLVQIELGKGNKPIRAPEDGVVEKVLCQEGGSVESKQLLFELVEAAQEKGAETQKENAPAEEVQTDLLIIGAGPGGYVAAIYAAKKGLKVVLVEKEELGGTCLNVGCIPTKALVKSSEICRDVREAANFGIGTEGAVKVDMEKIIRRKDEVKGRLVSGIGCLLEQNKVRVIRGTASFLSADKVSVAGAQPCVVSAKDILVATGSKCSAVPIPGIDLPMVMNSTQALSSTELPKSVTIVGGGVIGMEFAFLYRNLGIEVHVVEFLDRLLAVLDSEVSQTIRSLAEEAGIHVYTGTKVERIQRSEDEKAVVTCQAPEGQRLLVSDKVLVAIGREPCLDGLETEKAGLRLNDRGRGIAVDTHMRTNVEHIYAIGDVTNVLQLAHVASHQGITAVENILGSDREMEYDAVPNVVFTSPEIASVGLTAEDCRKRGVDCDVSTVGFSCNGKAMTMNETEGFIKLVRNKADGKLVGGSIIGADASSLIATLTVAMAGGLTDADLAGTIFAHPTTSEIIHEAALGFGIGAIHQA